MYASVCCDGHTGRLYLRGKQVHLDVLCASGRMRVQAELRSQRGKVTNQQELDNLAAELQASGMMSRVLGLPTRDETGASGGGFTSAHS